MQRFLERSAAREAHLSANGSDASCSKGLASSNVVTLRAVSSIPSNSSESGFIHDGTSFPSATPSVTLAPTVATVTPCVHVSSETLPVNSDVVMSNDDKTDSVDPSLHEPAVNVLTSDGVVNPLQESADITELAAEEALLNPSFGMDI